MPTYRFTGVVTGSKFLGEFEADDVESALKMLTSEWIRPSFCHQCAGECEDAQILSVIVDALGDTDADGEEYEI